ncbi:uncharacterized protein BDW43DRAFT_308484 [Aspergillus alliaceus]|uniref:uncharacterized protein n=1 Tax=Petromyces alliaceus TaxID=209559 RepID=UPI0012A479FF|nr:uncharacterized protein BDW43DRAFT_308484 [Aspergillus alliaceus]KAB8236218.1 hypothetical protein BDW43DRAFT_308484 [Aspergillus alliaceus]
MTTTTSTSTTTTTTPAKKPKTKPQTSQPETPLDLSANFANNRKVPVGYDHEVYLQLTAGRNAEKTQNQVYREERVRQWTTRALDPAILDPQGEPGPVDFECAEHEGVKERLR